MIQLFYKRVKDYTQSLIDQNVSEVASAMYKERDEEFSESFKDQVNTYTKGFQNSLSSKTLGEIAQGRFDIPKI
jgi:hypothetical protein